MSWKQVALSDLCEINIGKTPSRSNHSYWGPGKPWLSIADMNQGHHILRTKEQITRKAIEDTKIKIVPKGTVLFSFKLSIGKIGVAQQNMYTNEAIAALPILDKRIICEEFLIYALKHINPLETSDRAAMGATLNKKKLAALKIPLPPLSTQKQIAAVLDKADQLRKDCQQMEQELNALAQSVFIDMFGPSASDYTKWDRIKIEDLAIKCKGSMRTGPFGSDLKHSEFVDKGVAVIGIDNAVKNEFSWKERRFITEAKYEKLKRYTVYPNDVIITIMGTTGRVAVVPDDIPLAISTKHLAVITLDREMVEPEFLATALRCHPDVTSQIKRSSKGAIMDGLNLGLIKSLKISVPPIEQQKRYLSTLTRIRNQRRNADFLKLEASNHFQSLMQKAFKGELDLKGMAA